MAKNKKTCAVANYSGVGEVTRGTGGISSSPKEAGKQPWAYKCKHFRGFHLKKGKRKGKKKANKHKIWSHRDLKKGAGAL